MGRLSRRGPDRSRPLELGGKSVFVILDDADLQRAVAYGMTRCMRNSGQTCSSTRMLVPEAMIEDASRIAVAQARNHPTGDPGDPDSVSGPLVSAVQRDSAVQYIDAGVAEGATIALDGRGAVHDTGYYVGPVLAVMSYRDEDEAVRLVNGTDYGLAGAVWSGDPRRADAVARRIRAGQVVVNGAVVDTGAPFGGYKQSGIGREGGGFGFEKFLEIKATLR
ncbi:aldehyde dehydrogenase family protein [Rhodococcus sp. NPDC127530]|uniref:aldehyde dehydrogenase family protein n=1 Tax=unclassified Rhodococcus (in: high G+C Gram-positive bacteria) TaxID=192944 RepID=UPI0036383F2B